MHAPECIWDARAELGEGVRYDAATDSVWWVDILGRKVFCLELATGRRRQWDTPDVVGTTFPCSDGDVLLLLRHSLARLDQERGTCSPILDFPDEPATNRFNDGVVGPDGCIWVGSMDFDFQRPTGSLYLVRPDLSVARAAEGFTVINGPAFSPDGSVLYLCDTMSGVIYAFDRDAASNALSHKRVFLRLAEGDGLPDGICVDEERWALDRTGDRRPRPPLLAGGARRRRDRAPLAHRHQRHDRRAQRQDPLRHYGSHPPRRASAGGPSALRGPVPGRCPSLGSTFRKLLDARQVE